MDDLLGEFLTETNEGIAVLDGESIKPERIPNKAEWSSDVFRPMHAISGICGFLGLPRLEAVGNGAPVKSSPPSTP